LFGYIRPLEAQLRVCELEEYRAVYCGLCRSLGKRFGPMARMTLSYDFAFVTMLALSLREDAPSYSKQKCPFAPFHKRLHLDICPDMELACDDAVLLLREKCADNLADDGFWKAIPWRMASPLLSRAASRAAAERPDADRICREMTAAQQDAESDMQTSIDRACDPTANALASLLAVLSDKESEQRALHRLGYMLGRFIYLCDAVDDLEKDRADGAFNPLLTCEDKEIPAQALRLTIAEAARAYDLLPIHWYKGVLDTIIYLGLQNTADNLPRRRKAHEKSI
jgi:hypothetical protein